MVQSDLSKAFGINENRPSLPPKVTQTRQRKPPTALAHSTLYAAGIEVDESDYRPVPYESHQSMSER